LESAAEKACPVHNFNSEFFFFQCYKKLRLRLDNHLKHIKVNHVSLYIYITILFFLFLKLWLWLFLELQVVEENVILVAFKHYRTLYNSAFESKAMETKK
jgi:hypothetical protein